MAPIETHGHSSFQLFSSFPHAAQYVSAYTPCLFVTRVTISGRAPLALTLRRHRLRGYLHGYHWAALRDTNSRKFNSLSASFCPSLARIGVDFDSAGPGVALCSTRTQYRQFLCGC